MNLADARWHKSSFSGGGGDNQNCVEVALVGSATALRDSKNVHGPVLVVPTAAWTGLLTVTGAAPAR